VQRGGDDPGPTRNLLDQSEETSALPSNTMPCPTLPWSKKHSYTVITWCSNCNK